MDVQALKLRYARITFNISENIESYKGVMTKYKNDPQTGSRKVGLESKLNTLKETFESAFEPIEYINSATRMFKVL